MNARDILGTIRKADVWDPAPSAHLWLWVTDNYLQEGLWIMSKLGFRYVRAMVWVKMSEKEHDIHMPMPWIGSVTVRAIDFARKWLQIGLGQYLRGSHELCLLGAKGDSMVPEPQNRPPSVIFAERTKHSKKPDEAFQVFEKVSPGPRLEMFARVPREGWAVWGNEI
jgi:N6-adenosine-specific RNA methylase IME4